MAEGHGKRVVYFHLRSAHLALENPLSAFGNSTSCSFLKLHDLFSRFLFNHPRTIAPLQAFYLSLSFSFEVSRFREREREREGKRERLEKRFENSSSFRNVDVLSFSF